MITDAEIARNIALVRSRIAQACAVAGRPIADVTLLGVTKTVSPQNIARAYQEGLREFGENYAQEATSKIADSALQLPGLNWHFIGHLQRNKVREVLGKVALIQSVDSLRLAEEIGRRSQQAGCMTDILLEIKMEESAAAKTGLAPDLMAETAAQIANIEGVRLRGLMGIAPYSPDAEQARPHFRRLRALFEQLPAEAQYTLSMGMTGDFEVAIEEGSTLVRIGSGIFGKRNG